MDSDGDGSTSEFEFLRFFLVQVCMCSLGPLAEFCPFNCFTIVIMSYFLNGLRSISSWFLLKGVFLMAYTLLILRRHFTIQGGFVDKEVLDSLHDRFASMDEDGSGALTPSDLKQQPLGLKGEVSADAVHLCQSTWQLEASALMVRMRIFLLVYCFLTTLI